MLLAVYILISLALFQRLAFTGALRAIIFRFIYSKIITLRDNTRAWTV